MIPLVLFGDQTVETLDSVRSLLEKSKSSSLLKTFLTQAEDAVRHEIQKLDSTAQGRFYGFPSLIGLAEQFAKSTSPDDLVATVLMTIAQLGELILYAEADATVHSSDAVIVGLCTGVLPAAVCAVSKGINQILDLGIKVVSLAFRLAVESGRRSEQIEAGTGHWGYSVINVPVQDLNLEMENFHKERGIPPHRKAYLSVLADNWATISGPPSVLQDLFSLSGLLSKAPKLRLPFGAAAHAPHLPPLDLESLLDESGIEDTPLAAGSVLISTSTCCPYPTVSTRQLFRDALEDIVQCPLRLSDTIQGVLAEVVAGSNRNEQVDLVPVGPLSHTNLFERTLRSAGVQVSVRSLSAEADEPGSRSRRPDSGHIAIVGMSGRFPGSENISDFWQSLLDQREFHTKIPASRFDLDAHLDLNGKAKNATTVPYGNFLERPGLFDHRMFKVSPREALQMDPLQRIFLMCTYEALEMAGYSPNRTPSTKTSGIATFFGQAADDYRDTNINEGVDVYFVPALQRAFAPGRLNHHFGWGGPSYSVDSACASSLSAVLLASTALLSRQCDTAVAGGGSLLSNPAVFAGLSKGSFLSPTGPCKTFQASADGYCRGEGVGVVVMKRLEDALADNDNVLAVIRGAVRNYSAGSISITYPSSEMQQALYRDLLHQSGVRADQIGYVEMHGTATQAGDTAEMASVAAVLGLERPVDYPLHVGAVKANVGHGEASAGLTSLIKSIAMLKERVIPGQPLPSSGNFELNPNFPPLQRLGIRVPEKKQIFHAPRADGKRKILLNNFDAAGGNVSLILEEHRQHDDNSGTNENETRSYHVVAVSAHTPNSFRANRGRLLDYLGARPETHLASLAYTTTARRIHHPYRIAYVADSISQLTSLLSQDDPVPPALDKTGAEARIVFTFTGQGHRSRTLGSKLYRTSRDFRSSILSYHRLCEAYGFESFLGLVNGDFPKDVVPTTVQSQLATLAVELALAELWKSWNVHPSLVIGHSLGEYAALCTAGVLSVHDTLYLVGTRASLLQKAAKRDTHSMLAVGAGRDEALKILRGFPACEIACNNAAKATVISGPVDQIRRLKLSVKETGISATQLDTPYAFHSRQLDPMLDEFAVHSERVRFAAPRIPVASSLLGRVITEENIFNGAYLVQQARQPVEFAEALSACRSTGLADTNTFWIECGPQPICLGFVASTLGTSPDKLLPSLQPEQDDWKVISSSIAAVHSKLGLIDWRQFYQEHGPSLQLLDLPSYSFELKDFWMPFKDYSALPLGSAPAMASGTQDTTIRSLLTSSLQSLTEENITDRSTTVSFASLCSEPSLAAAMHGHQVDGYAICPTSIFTDMALSAARYVFRRKDPDTKMPRFSIHNMDITHPLVCEDGETAQQILVKASQSSNEKEMTMVSFSSQTAHGSTQSHGTCVVQAGNAEFWSADWSKTTSLVKLARQGLLAAVGARKGHQLSKSIVYKLFSQLVRYDEKYQTMEEVFVAEDFTQGSAQVRLGASGQSGNFMFSPYWIDALVHLAGFVVNCNPKKPDNILWVSTGFESMRVSNQLSPDKTYTNFVSFRGDGRKSEIIYDAYIFEDDVAIGEISGIRFHKMERSAFGALVRASSVSPSPSSAPVPPVSSRAPVKSLLANMSKTDTSVVDETAQATSTAKDRYDEVEAILATVAKQTGVDVAELDDSTMFADLGVDSLMSITITDVLQKELGISIPGAFFQENPSVADVRRALGDIDGDTPKESSDSSDESSLDEGYQSPQSSVDIDPIPGKRSSGADTPAASPKLDAYESRVVLIHGRKSSPATPLFLITDGAGSATAYLHLPSLPGGRPVYALESPFLHDPEAFRYSVEEVGSLYLAAVRRTQPCGPYLLGGWSAGAVFAYEVSRRLLDAGEEVSGLIMLDMRVPTPLPDHPEPTMELLEASGMTAGINRSSGGGAVMGPMSLRLKQHLLSVCRALVRYSPQPMAAQKRPVKAYMIWAKLGLSEVADGLSGQTPARDMSTDDATKRWFFGDGNVNIMEEAGAGMMAWFYAKRTSFGSNGWQKLLGQELKTWVVDADHFSMVAMPHALVTGEYIRDAVEECSR